VKCKRCKREIPDNSTFCNWCGKKQITDKQQGEIPVPEPRLLSSGKYFIQLRIDGESVSITEDDPEVCKIKARAIKTGLIAAKKKPEDITLTEAIDSYVESRKNIVSPSTIRSYKKIQRLRFQSLMTCRLQSITPSKLQKAITAEAKPNEKGVALNPKTIKDAYCFIKTVMMHNGVNIDFSNIALPQVQPSPYKTLSPDEIQTLITAIKGDPCEIPILLALWLGLRRSEIIALEKKDFDFKKKTVTISSALVQDEDNVYVEKGTKCAASVRVVSCPSYILDKVETLPEGRIYNHNAGYILKCLHRVCEQNDLPPVRLHDLRHVNASIMLMLNTPDKYAMERGGWATKQTMTGRYQHTYDIEKTNVDNTINTYFEGLISGQNANVNANA